MIHQQILFTKDECDKLIQLRFDLEQTLSDGGYPDRVDINYKQWTIVKDNSLDYLFNRIIDFVSTKFGVEVLEFNEPAWIYQYEINDGYIMHTDNILDRRFTIGVQLSDEYEGGDLMVDYNKQRIIVNKDIGNCYVFESTLLHGVSPVTSGSRFNFLTFMFKHNVKHNRTLI
jgi:PKHD-type hydroxylase